MGAVSIEAALGIGALLASFSLLAQVALIGVQYVRLLSVAVESAQMAAASGDLAVRLGQAEDWALEQLPDLEIEFLPTVHDVDVTIRQPLRLPSNMLNLLGVSWLQVTQSSVRVDAAGT